LLFDVHIYKLQWAAAVGDQGALVALAKQVRHCVSHESITISFRLLLLFFFFNRYHIFIFIGYALYGRFIENQL